ncbi:MAG: CinA family nicotinamide mononucleotide deamidase-related protein [Myxococcaceae bacterium]
MEIEVLCTGDELLTGIISDTNSAYFMGRLLPLGERVRRATVVGDAKADIVEALTTLGARSDFVLVSGGLGPTADDLTAEAAAEAAGVPLVEDATTLERIRRRFEASGLQLTLNNARQARVPQGARVVQNPAGTAPLFEVRIGRALCQFVAGVPREYRVLVDAEVLPTVERLLEAKGPRRHYAQRILRTIGLPESHLDARVAPLATRHPKVEIGFRTQPPENHLKLLARGATQLEAERRLTQAEQDARALLGDACFAADDLTLAQEVARLLQARGATLAVAESCTGGMVGALITDPAGASACFHGGAIAYVNALKTELVGVPTALIEEHTAVSEPVARAMAHGARSRCATTFGLAVTGYAGPTGGDPANPVGTVFLAVDFADRARCERVVFRGDRERIRRFAAFHALDLLRRTLLETAQP